MFGFTDKQLKERVKVLTYNQVQTMTRRAALSKFHEAMLVCEGSEAERYAAIFHQLLDGATFATDEV